MYRFFINQCHRFDNYDADIVKGVKQYDRIYDYGIACYYFDSTILHFDDHLRKEAG